MIQAQEAVAMEIQVAMMIYSLMI